MSGFKRYRSKVFWGHMASQDLENSSPFASGNDFAKVNRNCDRNGCIVEEEMERSSSINDSNGTNDTENITAIRVCLNENEERLYSPKPTREENLMTQM